MGRHVRQRDTCGTLIIPQNRNFIYNNFVNITSSHSTAEAISNKIEELISRVSHVYDDIMRSTTMRRMFGFLIGIFVGGVVGSTIALLMAPESGERLRGEIR